MTSLLTMPGSVASRIRYRAGSSLSVDPGKLQVLHVRLTRRGHWRDRRVSWVRPRMIPALRRVEEHVMGGTGGPGSDRSAAQTGLQGAGLLAGLGDTEAASATKKALGVADAPQPTSGMLAGTEGAIVAPPGPTSASDTPKDVTPVIPDVAAPGSPGYVAPST